MQEINLNQILLANVIVCIGAIVQGSIGFGFALISASILVLISQIFVPGPLISSGLLLSILIACRERRSIDFFGLKLAFIGRVIGAILGAWILLVVSKTTFAFIFGTFIITAVMLSASGISLTATGPKLLGAGFLSGVMATTTSVGGPPMALIYQNASAPTIRSTLAGFFIVGTIISLITLIVIGKFGQKEIITFVSVIPGILLGFSLSKYGTKVIDRGYIKKIILLMALLSGIALILRELF